MMKYFTAACAALILMATGVARAQVPSYAQGATDEQIHGRIVSYNGAYNLTVRDANGYVDHVELHQGTIINPTGIALEPGMVVSILGYNAGNYFDANEIDTPYTLYGAVPYYGGHPWTYYGPSTGISFFFGNPAWWHGDNYHGYYPYDGHVYGSHPGTYHAPNIVGPTYGGGYHTGGHYNYGGGNHTGGFGGGGGHGSGHGLY